MIVTAVSDPDQMSRLAEENVKSFERAVPVMK